jgi:hypothetical protein
VLQVYGWEDVGSDGAVGVSATRLLCVTVAMVFEAVRRVCRGISAVRIVASDVLPGLRSDKRYQTRQYQL